MATRKDTNDGKDKKNRGDDRKGDTSRTSNQGRKLASGGTPDQKGDPEIDENTKNPISEKNPPGEAEREG